MQLLLSKEELLHTTAEYGNIILFHNYPEKENLFPLLKDLFSTIGLDLKDGITAESEDVPLVYIPQSCGDGLIYFETHSRESIKRLMERAENNEFMVFNSVNVFCNYKEEEFNSNIEKLIKKLS